MTSRVPHLLAPERGGNVFVFCGQFSMFIHNPFYMRKNMCVYIISQFIIRERGGIVVERQPPNREDLGLIPTGVTVLCP